MSLKIMGFDIEAKQASDALKIAKREAIAPRLRGRGRGDPTLLGRSGDMAARAKP